MGLWVSAKLDSNYLVIAGGATKVYVRDTDDASVESCTVKDLCRYSKSIKFENVVIMGDSKVKIVPFLLCERLIDINGVLFFMERGDDYRLHIFRGGVRYVLDCDNIQFGMPIFSVGKVTILNFCTKFNGKYLGAKLEVPYSAFDGGVLLTCTDPFYSSGTLLLGGESCTKAQFLASLALGV